MIPYKWTPSPASRRSGKTLTFAAMFYAGFSLANCPPDTGSEAAHRARRGPGKKYQSSTNRHIVTYGLEGRSYNDKRAENRVRTRWCRDNCQANWTGAMREIRFDSLEDATLFVMAFGGSLKVAS